MNEKIYPCKRERALIVFVKAWQIYIKRLRIGNVNGEKALASDVSVFSF